MKRVLVFHPALAPYRVDFFNELGKLVELRVVFMTRNNANQSFDQRELLKDSTYSIGYLDRHYRIAKRNVNLGYRHEIDEFKPDVVICNEYGVSLWSCFVHQFTNHAKYKIFTICDDSEDVFSQRRGIRKYVSRYFVKKIDGIICINPQVAEGYRNIGARKVSLFPIIYKDSLYKNKIAKATGITNHYIDKYHLAGKKCILFVGRFAPVKNLTKLLESFARLSSSSAEELRLILVGDGEQRDKLLNLAFELGIDKNVLFPGRFEGNELLAWYNLDGVFILPSTYEPFGAVVSEALMAGMPVIASERVGAKCLINSDNGIICSSEDINDIYEKMREMLNRVKPIETITTVRASLLTYNFDNLMESLVQDLA